MVKLPRKQGYEKKVVTSDDGAHEGGEGPAPQGMGSTVENLLGKTGINGPRALGVSMEFAWSVVSSM